MGQTTRKATRGSTPAPYVLQIESAYAFGCASRHSAAKGRARPRFPARITFTLHGKIDMITVAGKGSIAKEPVVASGFDIGSGKVRLGGIA
jgi:hypothetical protein